MLSLSAAASLTVGCGCSRGTASPHCWFSAAFPVGGEDPAAGEAVPAAAEEVEAAGREILARPVGK